MCVHIRKNRRRLLYISLILHLSWKRDPLPSPYSSRYSPCSPLPSRSTAYTGPALAKVGMFFRQWSALPPNPWISTIGGPSLPCCIGEVGGGGQRYIRPTKSSMLCTYIKRLGWDARQGQEPKEMSLENLEGRYENPVSGYISTAAYRRWFRSKLVERKKHVTSAGIYVV